VKPLIGLHSNGRFQALPRNIRLVWHFLKMSNTLAYCVTHGCICSDQEDGYDVGMFLF
jgi:hypothetical protein